MAGKLPTFITGAKAKIKINDKTMAFCTDLSYSVQIITQTPKILGMYEGSSVEPLGYSVSGSFTVVRYAKGIKDINGQNSIGGLSENDAGNGIGNWGKAWGGDILTRNGVGNDGRPNENLDPSRLSNGTTFDIEVYQKVQTPDGKLDELGVAKIRSVRITQADFNITKKNPAIQKFNFVALYADEDSFVADFSGRGQHFQG